MELPKTSSFEEILTERLAAGLGHLIIRCGHKLWTQHLINRQEWKIGKWVSSPKNRCNAVKYDVLCLTGCIFTCIPPGCTALWRWTCLGLRIWTGTPGWMQHWAGAAAWRPKKESESQHPDQGWRASSTDMRRKRRQMRKEREYQRQKSVMKEQKGLEQNLPWWFLMVELIPGGSRRWILWGQSCREHPVLLGQLGSAAAISSHEWWSCGEQKHRQHEQPEFPLSILCTSSNTKIFLI